MDIELREVELEPERTELMIVRTILAGIDGTEVNRFFGALDPAYFDRLGGQACVMGDEILGEIVHLPRAAARWSGLSIGDRIVVEPKIPCQTCRYCVLGHEIHCESQRGFGVMPFSEAPGLWGGLSEYVCVPPTARVHRVPPGLSDERALLSAVVLADGYRWVHDKAALRSGEDILVIGPGPQGLATVTAAAAANAATVIAAGTDRDQGRLDLARALGATDTIDVDRLPLAEALAGLTPDGRVDAIVDCGSHRCDINGLIRLVRPLGRIVIVSVGQNPGDPLAADRLQKHEISIIGARGPRAHTVRAALGLAASAAQPVEAIITHRFPLDQVVEAFHVAGRRAPSSRDCVKTVIDFRAGPASARTP